MKKNLQFAFVLMLLLSVLFMDTIRAQATLPAIFTDNMVLQQQTEVRFWGWDKAGKNIKISTSWNGKHYTTKADASGKWMLKLATPKAGFTPYTITISDGKAIKLNNILIGEVWLCSGQSNMEVPMKGFKSQPIVGSNEAILKSKNSNIRLYTVPRSSTTELQANSKTSAWKMAEPESVSNFSATGYYFGKLLQEILGVPVGIINDSYSGSSIEAWMSTETLKAFPEIKIPAKDFVIKDKSRTPTTLYNGMLYPVAGFGIKGCIWYQGESNYDRPDQYELLFPAFVKQMRTMWNMGDFPFY
jgi:sialate O-acetylesterase